VHRNLRLKNEVRVVKEGAASGLGVVCTEICVE